MKKRLSYNLTILVFILAIGIYFGIIFWLSTYFNWPEWTYTIWYYIFILLVFEIPARLGPQPFDTILSTYENFCVRDKLIVGASFLAFIISTILLGENKDNMSLTMKVIFTIIMFAVFLGPIWIFCTPEAKAAIFNKNRYTQSSVKENSE